MSKTESAKPDTSVSFRTSIGGQALIEGILMRGPTRQAIVCRTQDGMVEKVEELHWVREKHPILGWPLIRGVIVFLDSMVKGMKALTYSADLLPEDEQEEPGKIDLWIEKHFGEEKAKDIIIGTAVVLGIALSIVLFILIPTLLAGLTKGFIHSPVVRNLFEGLLRIVIFLLYLWGVAHMKDVERMFAYHGADGRERAATVALPPPLRHELPVRRRHHQHSGVLAREPARRAVGQSVGAHRPAAAAAAGRRVHQL